ncbi:MAG: hypothetical protein ABFD54_12950 [Armatimonadota bacterium]|nr:hypothetical protein [bacterium]
MVEVVRYPFCYRRGMSFSLFAEELPDMPDLMVLVRPALYLIGYVGCGPDTLSDAPVLGQSPGVAWILQDKIVLAPVPQHIYEEMEKPEFGR